MAKPLARVTAEGDTSQKGTDAHFGEGDSWLCEPMCLLLRNWCKECSHCLHVF